MDDFIPEGAVKPSSLEVDSYDNSIGAYKTVAILHGNNNGTLVPISTDSNGSLSTSDESVALLKRMVKLLESSAVVDIANRQKVTLDASTAGFMSSPGVGVSLLGNPVATAAPGVPATAYPLYIWEMPVDQRWRVTEESHVSYQIGIRNQLAFT